MKFSDLKTVVDQGKRVLVKNSPEILTGLGIAGSITTVIFAVKVTPKALMLIDTEASSRGEEPDVDDPYGWGLQYLKPVDILKCTWKQYLPVAAMGTVSIACLIGSNRISDSRATALAGLYSLAEKTLDDYRDNVIKRFDKSTDDDIYHEVQEKQANELELPKINDTMIIPGKGPTLCYDPLIGRYFRSDKESIRSAVNDLNKDLVDGLYEDLNALYIHMDLPTVVIGDYIGWKNSELLDVDFTAKEAPNHELCLVIMFNTLPNSSYREVHY